MAHTELTLLLLAAQATGMGPLSSTCLHASHCTPEMGTLAAFSVATPVPPSHPKSLGLGP